MENNNSIRNINLTIDDKKHLKSFNLITIKPIIYVANIDEELISKDNEHIKVLRNSVNKEGFDLIKISASIEEQICQLNKEDQDLFLQEYNLIESGLNQLISSSYKTLGLLTFFTAGPKEVKAWTIKKGMTAPEAAGVIHTDFERGFIRAQTIGYESELKCKENGKISIEGKDYVLNDGDIVHFKFNV